MGQDVGKVLPLLGQCLGTPLAEPHAMAVAFVVKQNAPLSYRTVKQVLRRPSACRRAVPVMRCPQTGRAAT